MIKIELTYPTHYEERLAKNFASECVKGNKDEYAKRNQLDIDKLILDNTQAKIAEIIVHKRMKNNLKPNQLLTPIDFHIYPKELKTYDSDLLLIDNGIIKHFHIKSCQENRLFPNSWLFQPNDPIVIEPKEHDYLVLVLFPLKSLEIFAYIIRANEVVYGKAQKQSLNKKVIYESQLNENK